MRRSFRTPLILGITVLLAGCAGGSDAKNSKGDDESTPKADPVPGRLVVDGERIGTDAPLPEPARDRATSKQGTVTNAVLDALREATATVEPWPEPPLLPDGTIDDGP